MALHRRESRGESIVGVVPDAVSAERCVADLRRLGVSHREMFIAQKTGAKERTTGQQAGGLPPEQRGLLDDIGSVSGSRDELINALEHLGFAKDTATRYADLVDGENVLVGLYCDTNCDQLISAFDRHGVFDLRRSEIEGL